MLIIIGIFLLISIALLVAMWRVMKTLALAENKPLKDARISVSVFAFLIYIPAIIPYGVILSLIVMVGLFCMLLQYKKKKDTTEFKRLLNGISEQPKNKKVVRQDKHAIIRAGQQNISIDNQEHSESYDLDEFDSDTDIFVYEIVQFDYTNRHGESSSRRVAINAVGYDYFDAKDLDIGESRTFRYDRIDGDVLIERTGKSIRSGSLYEFFEKQQSL